DELWSQHRRRSATGRRLCGPGAEGRAASRSTGGATNQVRIGDQSQGRKGARSRCAADATRPRRRGDRMKRREFITLLVGTTAAGPLGARAQQRGLPVIGLLSSRSAATDTHSIAVIRQALNERGFVEGQNVVIDYRWADGQYDRLPVLATSLVH